MILPESVVEEPRESAKTFRLGRDIEGTLMRVRTIHRAMPLMKRVSVGRQAEGARFWRARSGRTG